MFQNWSSISAMMKWKNIETGWLHFIGTPDTKKLIIKVRDRVQYMLDMAHEKNPTAYKKRKVTFQIIPEYKQFANGESIADIESVRAKHVYYFSDPHGDAKSIDSHGNIEKRSLNDKLMHDYLAFWALREHGAKSANLVMQCMPYARQDKTSPGKREAASMDRIGKMLSEAVGESGYLLTTDLHNPASKSSFQWSNFINLYSWWVVKEAIKRINKGLGNETDDLLNFILAPADQWWYAKTSRIAEELNLKNTIALKTRDYSTKNKVSNIEISGDIKWKDVVIHDDILDSGGTLCTLLEKILEKSPKSVNIVITHGLFNKDAFEKLSNTIINSEGIVKKVYISNSVNKEIDNKDWIDVIDTSNILSNTIVSIFQWLGINRGDNTDYTK